MGRQAKLRMKNGHWFSEAGGQKRYFGRVDTVTYTEALRRFRSCLAGDDAVLVSGHGDGDSPLVVEAGEGKAIPPATSRMNERTRPRAWGDSRVDSFMQVTHDGDRKSVSPTSTPCRLSTITVSELRDRFLGWLERHRGERTHAERSRHLDRFCEANGSLPAAAIEGRHLESFTERLSADGHAPEYVRKHAVSVKAMVNRGVKMGWLPNGFTPFATVEAVHVDRRPVLETDLPSEAEVRALFAAADGLMKDVLTLYYNTGARTHELIEATVGDFQRASRTIVLGRHKRARTMRDPVPRTITLNADAFAVLERRSEGRRADDFLIVNRKGFPYTRWEIARRFDTVRRKAGVRSVITIYSFRHLFVSEMLMAGVDVLLVARMAGTSVKMIETTYGHFRTQSFADAQARLDAARKGKGD